MKFIQFALIFSILLLGCNSSKNIGEDKTKLGYDINFVDYLFNDYKGNRPGSSIIVIQDGNTELTRSFGYADIDNKMIATSKTNYRIASVTKQFTAMAIMILVNQGKLS